VIWNAPYISCCVVGSDRTAIAVRGAGSMSASVSPFGSGAATDAAGSPSKRSEPSARAIAKRSGEGSTWTLKVPTTASRGDGGLGEGGPDGGDEDLHDATLAIANAQTRADFARVMDDEPNSAATEAIATTARRRPRVGRVDARSVAVAR
jgi:hypothetical protein